MAVTTIVRDSASRRIFLYGACCDLPSPTRNRPKESEQHTIHRTTSIRDPIEFQQPNYQILHLTGYPILSIKHEQTHSIHPHTKKRWRNEASPPYQPSPSNPVSYLYPPPIHHPHQHATSFFIQPSVAPGCIHNMQPRKKRKTPPTTPRQIQETPERRPRCEDSGRPSKQCLECLNGRVIVFALALSPHSFYLTQSLQYSSTCLHHRRHRSTRSTNQRKQQWRAGV